MATRVLTGLLVLFLAACSSARPVHTGESDQFIYYNISGTAAIGSFRNGSSARIAVHRDNSDVGTNSIVEIDSVPGSEDVVELVEISVFGQDCGSTPDIVFYYQSNEFRRSVLPQSLIVYRPLCIKVRITGRKADDELHLLDVFDVRFAQ